MSGYTKRQLDLLVSIIAEYESDKIQLNSLVQKLDALTCAIDLDAWDDDVYRIRVALETVNAVSLDENRPLNDFEKDLISKKLQELQLLIENYNNQS